MLETVLYIMLVLLIAGSTFSSNESKRDKHNNWQSTIAVLVIFICLTVVEINK